MPRTIRTLIAPLSAVLLALGFAGTAASPARAAGQAQCPWVGSSASPAARAAEVLSQMTLDEKIQMVHGTGGQYVGNVAPIPRLCVPALNLQDGRAGVGGGMSQVTLFPAPIADSASWDTGVIGSFGQALGAEQRGKGSNVELGPTVNPLRVPEWGRDFESYGEDPYLNGQMAASEIRAIQSQGVIANANMYATMNQEINRGAENSIVDERTLQEIYLPPFQAAVQQGGVGSIMCAYVLTNGAYSCENNHLLNDVLKDQWGFPGWVMSDWGATHSTVDSATAGLDQQMPDAGFFGDALKQAVRDGRVPAAQLDDMVSRILSQMFRFGLFEHPQTGTPGANVQTPAHAALARSIAEQGTVLLKNSGGMLPLDSSALKSVAVIGQDAQDAPVAQGGGSSHVQAPYVVTPYSGIKQRAGSGVNVQYAPGLGGQAQLQQAVQLAKSSNVAIVFAGVQESEGADLPNMQLPNGQDQLIQAVADANPNTVVVLNTGGPVLMPWIGQVKGIAEAWYPGQEDGNAIAAVLFGDTNPGGHLPMTFPASQDQTPIQTQQQWPGVNGNSSYTEGLDVGYRWYDANQVQPLFPFGYGLSYTQFAFSHLAVTPQAVVNTSFGPGAAGNADHQVDVSAQVTNTGARAGSDVAQLYLGDPSATGEPPRQLKGFQKVSLKPGQSTTVHFTLNGRDLAFWKNADGGWVVPDGTFQVQVGDSSGTSGLPLHGQFDVINSAGGRTATLAAPATATPGTQITLTGTFTNDSDFPANDVSYQVAAPAGWDIQPAGSQPAEVPAHHSVQLTWRASVPYGAQATDPALALRVSYQTAGGSANVRSAASQIRVSPLARLAVQPAQVDLDPGGQASTTLTITNNVAVPVSVNWQASSPAGLTLSPATGSVSLGPGASSSVPVNVSASGSAAGGPHTIGIQGTAGVQGSTYQLPAGQLAANVSYSSLAASYDNIAITDDGNHVPGNLDGNGYSYSAQALAQAGLAPGATVSKNGVTFTWPGTSAGTADNTVANGQAIRLSGSGSTLALVGTGIVWTGNTISGTGTITYTDGTTQQFTVAYPNWVANQAIPGTAIVATSPYINPPPGGTYQNPASIYMATVALQSGKTVDRVVLPQAGGTVAQGSNAMHIFAMAIS